MEFGAKIMVLATFLLGCVIVASSHAEPLQKTRISRRDIDAGTALINDITTNYGYPRGGGEGNEEDEDVEAMLRRTILLRTYWRLCTELNACDEDTPEEQSEEVLPPRTSRGHFFWRTGILVPPGKGRKLK